MDGGQGEPGMRFSTVVGRLAAAWAVLAVSAVGGCGPQGAVDVQELAAALKRQGVAYEVSETAALGSIRAEGLRLTGPDLEVELYVIDDEADMKHALTAVALMKAGQRSAGGTPPAKAYAHGDVFVLVRTEPVEGQVREALERALQD